MRARVERGQTVVRAALLVAAVGLVGVLLYRQGTRMYSVKRLVWVAAGDMKAGQMVTAGSLRPTQESNPPKGAVVDRSNIEGRPLLQAKAAGQPFYPNDLAPKPVLPALATTLPTGRLLATLRLDNMDLPAQELRAGDRLDIVAADQKNGAVLIAHDAQVLGAIIPPPQASTGDSGRVMGIDISIPGAAKDSAPASRAALILALRPVDVLPVSSAEVAGTRVKIILHSEAEVASGKMLNVVPPPAKSAPIPSVEILKGSKREKVYAADTPRRVIPAVVVKPTPAPVKVASR